MKNQKSLLTIAIISMLTACSSTKTRRVAGVEKETIESTLPTMKEVNLQDLQNKKKDKLEGKEKEEFEKVIDFANKGEYKWELSSGVGFSIKDDKPGNWYYKLENGTEISFNDIKFEAQDKGLKGYLIAKKDKIDDPEFSFNNIAYGDMFKKDGAAITAEQAKDRAKILNKWISGQELLESDKDVIKLLADVLNEEFELVKFSDITDKQHLNNIKLLAYHLGQGNTENKIKYEVNYADILKTGANSVNNGGLNFSNFGVWEGVWDVNSVNNPLLKDILKIEKGVVVSYNTFFYSGVEKLKSSVKEENNTQGMTFSGKTLAVVAANDNTQQRLTGSAKITIAENDTKGNLELAFDDWHTLSFNGLELGNEEGTIDDNDHTKWVITGTSKYDKFDLTDKHAIGGNGIVGALYGAEKEKATEAVGTYGIRIDGNFYLNGAFGVKKDN